MRRYNTKYQLRLIHKHHQQHTISLRNVDPAVDQTSGMEQKFTKLQTNRGLRRGKVRTTAGVFVGVGKHEVDRKVAFIMVKLDAGMTFAVLAVVVVFQDVRLIAVHLDTGRDAVDQASRFLNIGDHRFRGIINVGNFAESNILLGQGI